MCRDPQGPYVECRTMDRPAVRRILVVEDFRCFRNNLTLRGELQRHELCNAYDALDALQVAHEFCPELVFIDFDTPGLDGHGLARALRYQTGGREIILVALSAWVLPQARRRSLEAGFDEHFIKPLAASNLQKVLARTNHVNSCR